MLIFYIGTSVVWLGTLRLKSDIPPFVIFSYLYKILFEAAMTLVNAVVCSLLKKADAIDVYYARSHI
ncbi:MAG: hypothetical protein A3F17_01610 [Gammaproteobacteria bacterium RIFCSPHIGHO2_12_FULL_41_15]|nr:MAG: hypothetical protein A3F17_01610 [Gammaproteobacteria bacterium RIFCSPHIGHO2_12_FULL_41_15]